MRKEQVSRNGGSISFPKMAGPFTSVGRTTFRSVAVSTLSEARKRTKPHWPRSSREETKRPVDYRKGARTRRLADRDFMDAFSSAKERVQKMEFRAVDESDQTRQTLLEVYCAITLKTPHNDLGTH